jgi:hypothetical protein
MKTDGQSQSPHYAYILRISGKEYVKEKLNIKAVYKLVPNSTTPCNLKTGQQLRRATAPRRHMRE